MNCPRKNALLGSLVLGLCVSASAQEKTNSPEPAAAQSSPTVSAQKHDYWAVEDPKEREKLPLYKTIPAAKPEELTPASGLPKDETFLTWHRSHGDNGGRRYSALTRSTAKMSPSCNRPGSTTRVTAATTFSATRSS